jgi:putative peptide zinc metalloprotease protein
MADGQLTSPETGAHTVSSWRDEVESRPDASDVPPRLANGIELIGKFEGSGFKNPPYIARRRDGQVVQMPQLLFMLAEQVDGRSSVTEITCRFSEAIKRKVAPEDAQMLIDEQLRPLGIVASGPGQESVELGKVDPLLALKFRVAVVPDRAVRSLTTIFWPLFVTPVMALAVAGFVALDGWLFFVHGISQSVRHLLYQPALMLMLIAGVVISTAFHETGHATACRYGGARPGVMGVGIYIVWPAFYTDITDAYRLGKWGRLRTDVGGMYFNAVFALIIAGLYALTRFEPLLLLIVLQTFTIIQQSLPLLRLDGYYILSDLTGVPDIFLRIRAVLSSLIPGRAPDPRVTELKGWVRVIVSFYVLLIALFLLVAVVGMVINLPRVLATGYDSAALRYQAIAPDFGHGQTLKGALDIIEMLFLILPCAGLLYTGGRVGKRTTAGALRWSSGHPERQAVLGLAGAGAIALAAFSWWPNGEYRPIQPGERGTLAGLFQQVEALPTGRPSLTVRRQRQLGGAPYQWQRHQQPARRTTRIKSDRGVAPNSNTTTGTDQTPTNTTPTTTTTAQPATGTTTPSSTGSTTGSNGATTTTTQTTSTTTTPTTTTTSTTSQTPTTKTP